MYHGISVWPESELTRELPATGFSLLNPTTTTKICPRLRRVMRVTISIHPNFVATIVQRIARARFHTRLRAAPASCGSLAKLERADTPTDSWMRVG